MKGAARKSTGNVENRKDTSGEIWAYLLDKSLRVIHFRTVVQKNIGSRNVKDCATTGHAAPPPTRRIGCISKAKIANFGDALSTRALVVIEVLGGLTYKLIAAAPQRRYKPAGHT